MTDSTLKHGVPRTLDDPARIFWWDLDQAMLFSICGVLGMVLGSLMGGLALGTTLGWVYGRAKSGRHRMFAVHAIYWHLPGAIMKMRRTPSSDARELIG